MMGIEMGKQRCLTASLTIFLLAACFTSFGSVRASTEVTGIIHEDTVRTKEGSPYTLTGPIAIDKGVTLTIQPGVTVYGYYIQVNGTIDARGNSTDKITLNTKIVFMNSSTDWNEESDSRSIIENASYVEDIIINDAAPKINSNRQVGKVSIYNGSPIINNSGLYELIVNGGSPTISYNNVSGILIFWGSPLVSNNFIMSSNNFSYNNVALLIGTGAANIFNNTIKSQIFVSEPHTTCQVTLMFTQE